MKKFYNFKIISFILILVMCVALLPSSMGTAENVVSSGVEYSQSKDQGTDKQSLEQQQIISVDITVSSVLDADNKSISYRPYTIDKLAVNTAKINLKDIDMTSLGLISGKQYKFSLNVRVAGLSSATPTVKLINDYLFVAK